MPGYTLRFMKKRGIVQESGFEVGRLVKVFFFFFFSKSFLLLFLSSKKSAMLHFSFQEMESIPISFSYESV